MDATAATAALEEELTTKLEASRARVAGLRRALSREEELSQQQAEKADALEERKKSLDVEVSAAETKQRAIEAKQSAMEASAEAHGRFKSAPAEPMQHSYRLQSPERSDTAQDALAVDCDFDGPLSLEDLKRYLQTVHALRRRVTELESALDSKEEEVATLTDDVEKRRASL